jgi:probable rRNA maturation factor
MASSGETTATIDVNYQDNFWGDLAVNCPISSDSWQSWLQTWLTDMLSDVPAALAYELSLRLTTDSEIQALNAQYRHKNTPTDVLAFAALEVDCPQIPQEFSEFEPLYLGDIIISVETAERQAREQGHPLAHELVWLASHGFLHLLGWDHPDDDSLTQMLSKQTTLLKIIGFLPHNW